MQGQVDRALLQCVGIAGSSVVVEEGVLIPEEELFFGISQHLQRLMVDPGTDPVFVGPVDPVTHVGEERFEKELPPPLPEVKKRHEQQRRGDDGEIAGVVFPEFHNRTVVRTLWLLLRGSTHSERGK